MWCVYIHTSPSNKYYVGITSKEPKVRWGHNGNAYKTQYFSNAIKKYGWDNFQHEIIAENLTEDEAKNFEKVLISKLRSNERDFGYNITKGGDGVCGFGLHGELNPMYGKKHSEETLKKISQSRKGKCVGEDNPYYGKHHSKEVIDKILKSRSWYVPSEETIKRIAESNKKKVVQYDLENNNLIKIHKSAKDASDDLNIDKGSITKCCQHKRKSAGGYRWEYYEKIS